ncbi:hypothetical protein B0H15DRAFT_814329 [Mycena belliarum]|uniref:AAA-ATPase-like domain-containing protein n=1 Tax=Mycena belliarum TaxID=1033014 RepID=A0AAD6UH87_9AGAR|nr:hypothetical protein B0H15DRAFT_814329 [Mycena belliae]
MHIESAPQRPSPETIAMAQTGSADPFTRPEELDFSDGGLLRKDSLDAELVVFEDSESTPFSKEEEFDGVAFLSNPKPKRAWLWSDDETDEDSSSGSEPGPHKRARTRSLSPISFSTDSLNNTFISDNHRELPWTNYDFLKLRQHPETVYVDKTRCILQLPDKFRYILLRPPRFGKTAFLSTLNQYYDVRGAQNFAAHFGSLVVAEASGATQHRHQHLCLSFTLSDIHPLSDITDIDNRLTSHILFGLRQFVMEYAEELQLSNPESFLQPTDPDVPPNSGDLFAKVLGVVRSRGHTLFVGVDDYDAPVRRRSFMRLEFPDIPESFASPKDIECLFDTSFWGPLRAGSDVITKLFVTGTVSVSTSSSVNLRALDLEAPPALDLSCGFTKQEALAFAGAFLDTPLDNVDLRCICGPYMFSPPTAAPEAVFHPQQLILHIAELTHKSLMRFKPALFPLLPGIFQLLPEDSDDLGIVTTNGMIDLLASGTLKIEEDSLRDFDGTAVTWSVVRDLGVLTYDHLGALRVANSTVLSLIHAHVDTVFADRHDLQERFFSAFYAYDVEEDPTLLVELFSTILCAQAQRALARSGEFIEPTVHGIFELVMRNTRCAEEDRKTDPVVLLPPHDMPVVDIRNPIREDVQRWALTTLSLRGMWHGANPNASGEPSVDDLRELHAELKSENEEGLVTKYCVLAGERVLVGSLLKADPGIPVLLAVGGARVLMRKHSTLYKIHSGGS